MDWVLDDTKELLLILLGDKNTVVMVRKHPRISETRTEVVRGEMT